MNILILGGTGSIGQALTELLKNTAWNVYVTTRTKRENVQKALGDIRGVTYIYGMFYRFGLIDVPDEVKEKMGRPKDRKKNRLLCTEVCGNMCRN